MIEGAYAARERGDKDALAKYWAEGARFRIAGSEGLLDTIPLRSDSAQETVGDLMDLFTFSELQRLEAVVEDNKVAVRWAVKVSLAGQAPVRTELMDLIHLDDDGRIQSLVQFADTAQIRSLIAARDNGIAAAPG
jgi:ketosteroid isomerase-like protein